MIDVEKIYVDTSLDSKLPWPGRHQLALQAVARAAYDDAAEKQHELQAKLAVAEQDKQDAKRYRYIRDAGIRDYSVICEAPNSPYLKFNEDLDSAIDAARGKP